MTSSRRISHVWLGREPRVRSATRHQAALSELEFVPLGLPRVAEAAGAALVCIVVSDLIGIIWRWVSAKVAERRAHA